MFNPISPDMQPPTSTTEMTAPRQAAFTVREVATRKRFTVQSPSTSNQDLRNRVQVALPRHIQMNLEREKQMRQKPSSDICSDCVLM